jgi:acetate kinase
MPILSINAGSTSLKCSLFDLTGDDSDAEPVKPLWQAEISWHSQTEGKLEVSSGSAPPRKTSTPKAESRYAVIKLVLELIWTDDKIVSDVNAISCVGHRVVHGGGKYDEPVIITESVIADLHNYEKLAPNHEKENLLGISVARELLPKATQVAVFDTAFYHALPVESAIYALPYDWYTDRQIRRYGFHGISHSYCLKRATKLLFQWRRDLKIITCHLGGGSSVSASAKGRCLNTTMGFTPLEGLVMQTRSGSIDPGLIIYLLENGYYSVADLNAILTKQSGLKALSGLSGDMKEILHAIGGGNERAKLAFDVFVNTVAKYIASFIPDLGGLDALVFAGGIGENSNQVRTAVCRRFGYLGIEIDEAANASSKNDREINTMSSKVKVLIVHTQEELEIARSVRGCVGSEKQV